jgi:type IV pilus assembly protein PilN
MIRINLIKEKEFTRKEIIKEEIFIASVVLVVIIIVFVFIYDRLSVKIKHVDAEISSVTNDIERFKKEIGEIDKFKLIKENLENKLSVIKELEDGRKIVVKVMDELSRTVPDKLWIENLREGNLNITMDGIALDNETIATFMINLEKSPYFKDVDLEKIEYTERNKIKLKRFSIRCNIEIPKKG